MYDIPCAASLRNESCDPGSMYLHGSDGAELLTAETADARIPVDDRLALASGLAVAGSLAFPG